MKRFGRFDDDAREYVISRPDTPLPWVNYLGNEGFFGIISNTGGGYAFYRDEHCVSAHSSRGGAE